MNLGTKAETLEAIGFHLKQGKTVAQLYFSVDEWKHQKESAKAKVRQTGFLRAPLVVRSSAHAEDGLHASLAGHFETVLNVVGEENLEKAIAWVIDSYGKRSSKDQVLIQPMLQGVVLSGVAFSKNPSTGAPYIIINYDDQTGTTDTVTSGITNELKSFYYYKRNPNKKIPPQLGRVVALINELEQLMGIDSIDIEFAFTENGDLYLLQARPLVARCSPECSEDKITSALTNLNRKIDLNMKPHPYLYGSKTIYGVMPDWNPAEIIGIRPKPLAISLYKEVITDSIWAYQRDNYGYRKLRGFPLLHSFYGQPYIDVRVSFNSFIPATLEGELAERLVNYYLLQLEQDATLHDKVEFEIIYSCYTLDLRERMEALRKFGFSQAEQDEIANHLRKLTNRIIDGKSGLWKEDIQKIDTLSKHHQVISGSDLDTVSKIYWLLEDCKRYGTLPFAGLARAGFIAIQLLKSLVSVGILSLEEYNCFLESLDTVSSQMNHDLENSSKTAFLRKYGHLRPGTYDILSLRYDEAPDRYFNWDKKKESRSKKQNKFSLSLSQMKEIESQLLKHGLNHNVISFFDFLKSAIEGREYAKFVFTRNLSDILALIEILGKDHGILREECSFIDLSSIKNLYASVDHVAEVLQKSIENGKMHWKITQSLSLPSVITSPDDVFAFHQPSIEPNFITLKAVEAPACLLLDKTIEMSGTIVFIVSADPGYDWIFSHQIAGFVTKYGGVNSHMAIRAGELGIPAVIGAGELLYEKWSKAEFLRIDCSNKKVQILR